MTHTRQLQVYRIIVVGGPFHHSAIADYPQKTPRIKMSATISSTGGPIYFFREHEQPYGFLSQWFNAPFTAPSPDPDAEPMTFSTTEQYMMYQKAILFKDSDIADQIMLATTPAKQRSLGRKVKNFDRVVWDAHREEIVEEGNWNKFCSSKKGSKWKEMLVQTGNRELVEVGKASKLIRPMTNQVLKASPFDR